MNKKGVELTLSTIVTAIIVVMVLIVVVTFFLGGFSRVRDTIANVFFPVTSGTDLSIAVQTCEQRCDQARLLPTSVVTKSSYCTGSFSLDTDGDGSAQKDSEGKLIKFYCYSPNLGVNCEVKDKEGQSKELKEMTGCSQIATGF